MPTVDQKSIDDAAHRLATAAETGMPCAPVRDLIHSGDVDAAYRIQSLNVQTSLSSGRRIVGRKVGLTSPAVQKQLGVDQPDFGVLLDDMDVTREIEVDVARLLQPRIEAEIAFRLSRDITHRITVDQAPDYVSDVYASFEIVDSRIANWDISLADTVADNASSGLYILGDRIDRAHAPDLAAVEMLMTENGSQVSSGKGLDCLGSPWISLVWLANTALAYRSCLGRGDVVLSGALGPMVAVTPGATYTAEISDVGSVAAHFSR